MWVNIIFQQIYKERLQIFLFHTNVYVLYWLFPYLSWKEIQQVDCIFIREIEDSLSQENYDTSFKLKMECMGLSDIELYLFDKIIIKWPNCLFSYIYISQAKIKIGICFQFMWFFNNVKVVWGWLFSLHLRCYFFIYTVKTEALQA